MIGNIGEENTMEPMEEANFLLETAVKKLYLDEDNIQKAYDMAEINFDSIYATRLIEVEETTGKATGADKKAKAFPSVVEARKKMDECKRKVKAQNEIIKVLQNKVDIEKLIYRMLHKVA